MHSMFRMSALIVATTLLSACGGGGGESETSTPPSGDSPITPPTTPTTPTEPTVPTTPTEPPPLDAHQVLIEQTVGTLLFVEAAGKSPIKEIPTLIKDEITAHGPSPVCDSTCDADARENWYSVSVPGLGPVRVVHWRDLNQNLIFDPLSEQLAFDFTDVGGITGSAMVMRDTTRPDMYNMTLNSRYDDSGNGAKIGNTLTLRYSGALMVRTVENNRIRIGDFDLIPSPTRNILLQVMSADGTQRRQTLDTRFTMDTNPGDEDSIDATFDWIRLCANCIDSGPLESFHTLTSLNFGEIDGRLQLEAGSFLITQDIADAKQAVRVSVDADPGFLLVEVDAGADGSFETTKRFSQPNLSFVLP